MNLKNIELLTGAPADILAEIKPKKSYTVTDKVIKRNELAREKRLMNAKEKPTYNDKPKVNNDKDEHANQLQKLLKRIDELESNNKKIKPLEIKEAVDVNKPVQMAEPEPLPPSMEEQYRAKLDIVKNEIVTNPVVIPSLPNREYYKQPTRINSILPYNWKDNVQKQQLSSNSINLNKYLKGRK